jgi:uncharacterized OsmC-like protein
VGKTDDGVLIIRRIHVHYLLEADEEHRDTVERVHGMHAMKCPVYRTLRESIEITTDFELGAR